MSIKNKCPVCSKLMKTVVVSCSECKLEMRGEFSSNVFTKLSDEMAYFLSVFIHCEGKIIEMEKALGISYPTVKNKLTELKKTVGSKPTRKAKHESVMEVLNKLDSGKMSFAEGLDNIKQFKKEKR